MIIINGTDLVLGRLATYAARKSLLGEKVIIVNCENVVLTGSKDNIVEEYKRFRDMGYVYKGPFMSKFPDRILRRAIRGMLPYKQERGDKAFRRIMCYMGIPEKFKNEKLETVEKAKLKLKNIKYINLKALCNKLGAKI